MMQEEFRRLLGNIADGLNAGTPTWPPTASSRTPSTSSHRTANGTWGGASAPGVLRARCGVLDDLAPRRIRRGDARRFRGVHPPRVGEFTQHGITAVEVEDGLISGWREYQYRRSFPSRNSPAVACVGRFRGEGQFPSRAKERAATISRSAR